MKKRRSKQNYTFRVLKNCQAIQRYQTHSKRRFYNQIGTINWQDCPLKVYLRVSYGRGEDAFGKTVAFYNDGTYETKEELLQALEAFTE
jgi:hypothetical protein